MTELSAYLEILHWSQIDFSIQLNINVRTAQRMVSGKNKTPQIILEWVKKLAEFHLANPVPEGWFSQPNQ